MKPETEDIVGIRRRIEELAAQIRACRASEHRVRIHIDDPDAAADARALLQEAIRAHEALISELRGRR